LNQQDNAIELICFHARAFGLRPAAPRTGIPSSSLTGTDPIFRLGSRLLRRLKKYFFYTPKVFYIGVMKDDAKTFTLDELSALTGISRRNIRYYIDQKKMVDQAEGTARGAHYTQKHLSQLLQIRQWQQEGYSLERIRELLQEGAEGPPPPRRKSGTVEVWSRLTISEGVELHINAQQADLSPENLRALLSEIQRVYEQIARKE
jgi:DNA-binding transcriptional MerR regulator